MDYEKLNRLEDLMKYQIKFLDYIQELIGFDEKYAAENPLQELPPIKYLDELKSHFLLQKKACESVISITARHLPRLKAEREKNKKQPTKVATPQQAKNRHQTTANKPQASNKPPEKPPEQLNFISLF